MSTFVLHPVTPAEPEILRAFSRTYDPRGIGSYLDRIHTWAQRARVPPVMWDVVQGADNQFYAVPEFPDVYGREYSNCCGRGATQDLARQNATQYLQHYISAIHFGNVRWKFGQVNSTAGLVHCAAPVVYERPCFLQGEEVLGKGPTHQAAKEDSARKLLELGYCRI